MIVFTPENHEKLQKARSTNDWESNPEPLIYWFREQILSASGGELFYAPIRSLIFNIINTLRIYYQQIIHDLAKLNY